MPRSSYSPERDRLQRFAVREPRHQSDKDCSATASESKKRAAPKGGVLVVDFVACETRCQVRVSDAKHARGVTARPTCFAQCKEDRALLDTGYEVRQRLTSTNSCLNVERAGRGSHHRRA